MQEEFWHSRWRENRIGFHEGRPNTLLIEHFGHLALRAADTVFVPLCGKAVDLDWLKAQGFDVVGIELNEEAVKAIFARQGLLPDIATRGALTLYQAERLRIFVGNVFGLTAELLGPVQAVYDRAALVALPREMRVEYATHLARITEAAPQLVISFDYDQSRSAGPPFSVPNADIAMLYHGTYQVRELSSRAITGPLAERRAGQENAVLLKPE